MMVVGMVALMAVTKVDEKAAQMVDTTAGNSALMSVGKKVV